MTLLSPLVGDDVRACGPNSLVVGCAVLSAPRTQTDARIVCAFVASGGALGTARPTFNRAGEFGNTP